MRNAIDEITELPTWEDFGELFDYLLANYPRIDQPAKVKALWFKSVKWWHRSDMVSAFRTVIETEDRFFPTWATFKSCRPLKHKTADDWDNNGYGMTGPEPAPDTTSELEQRIDSMNDEEVLAAFLPLYLDPFRVEHPGGCYNIGNNPKKSAQFALNSLRRNPSGVYRTVLRDLIR